MVMLWSFFCVTEILGEEPSGFRRRRGGEDEAVPERKLVEDAAINALFDDRRGDLHDVENTEVAEVLPGLRRRDPELAGRGGVKLLEHLGGNYSGPVLCMTGDEFEGRVLLGRIGAVHGIDQEVGIQETTCGHESITVEFLAIDL